MKRNRTSSSRQTFYCFDGGILGRTGNDFRRLPVIENGFWHDGVRKTLAVTYDSNTQQLQKICFVQQVRSNDTAFDVSASDPLHVSVLPKQPSGCLEPNEDGFLFYGWRSTF